MIYFVDDVDGPQQQEPLLLDRIPAPCWSYWSSRPTFDQQGLGGRIFTVHDGEPSGGHYDLGPAWFWPPHREASSSDPQAGCEELAIRCRFFSLQMNSRSPTSDNTRPACFEGPKKCCMLHVSARTTDLRNLWGVLCAQPNPLQLVQVNRGWFGYLRTRRKGVSLRIHLPVVKPGNQQSKHWNWNSKRNHNERYESTVSTNCWSVENTYRRCTQILFFLSAAFFCGQVSPTPLACEGYMILKWFENWRATKAKLTNPSLPIRSSLGELEACCPKTSRLPMTRMMVGITTLPFLEGKIVEICSKITAMIWLVMVDTDYG